jgi:hypothetical protein
MENERKGKIPHNPTMDEVIHKGKQGVEVKESNYEKARDDLWAIILNHRERAAKLGFTNLNNMLKGQGK